MASNDAWQLGADIARGTVGQKKKQGDDTDSAPSDAWSTGAKIAQNRRDRNQAKSTLRKAQGPTTGLDTTQTPLTAMIPSFKHGGRVKRTGLAYLHKNEYVVPAKHRDTRKASRQRTITKR